MMRNKKVFLVVFSLVIFLLVPLCVFADTVVLPWVIKSNTVLTLVTTSVMQGTKLELNYFYKNDVSNTPNALCSKETLLLEGLNSTGLSFGFDASGKINDGRPIWVSGQIPVQNSLSLKVGEPRRAVLELSSDGKVLAEVMVVDVANGAAWGYNGINTRSLAEDVNISDSNTQYYTTFWKPGFITKFFITPLNAEGRVGNYCVSTGMYLVQFKGGSGGSFSLGLADNYVACTGVIDAEELAKGSTLYYRKTVPDEVAMSIIGVRHDYCDFWGGDGRIPASKVLFGKLEYAIGQGKIQEGSIINGTFNNFVVLKKNNWIRDFYNSYLPGFLP